MYPHESSLIILTAALVKIGWEKYYYGYIILKYQDATNTNHLPRSTELIWAPKSPTLSFKPCVYNSVTVLYKGAYNHVNE